MKRVEEKVKDIVEVCPFMHLHDFAADPIQTMTGYHFTDITADLMAKWIDKIGSIRSGQGAALALAGFRGVGKSHFLAVLGAIISRPELRSRIGDPHVASAADGLSRRHNPVAFVRRGSGHSLMAEFKDAIAEVLGVMPATLSDSLYELLLKGVEKAGEQPLVLLIDTSIDRNTRVARDDGAILGEIAEAAKALGIFVGVALDDDISGADGPNSSISACFSIDYLDQEHLYKIVDAHIFSKHSKMLPVLHDIYEYYREVLPGFRWSEPRFSSLYPLHPATLEIAPLIRLYIQDFALLGFASEAGVKILGRPANSLIGLDEVFDAVEKKLRNVPDLQEAFSSFDTLEREVVAKTAVQSRLQAKLILKGLLLLSLNGLGATAADLAASMLIFSETAGNFAAVNIGDVLDNFVSALPSVVTKNEVNGAGAKYLFKLGGRQDNDDVIANCAAEVSDDIIRDILMRQTAEKYSDIETSTEFGGHPTACSVAWRGSIRRGEIVWSQSAEDAAAHISHRGEPLDWTVLVQHENSTVGGVDPSAESTTSIWRLANLTSEEKDSICRYHVLQTNTELRDLLGDSASTALHIQSIAVEKAWQRVFLYDGQLVAGDSTFDFSDSACSSHSLAQLFTITLAPIFDLQYPEHAEFSGVLGVKQAANLIADFFSGRIINTSETQNLAETFALPLGLAVKQRDGYAPAPAEVVLDIPFVRQALTSAAADKDGVIPLDEISSRLRSRPYGLTREAQHMVLAGIVGQRLYEFVTSNGNRINHRSLDLQIIWDDIVGLAKPLNDLYSTERLLIWAKLVTGNAGIRSLDRSEDRLLVIDSMSGWLAGWREGRILDSFDALPDEHLNAAIWRTAASLRKSFGAVAETVDALVINEVTLDQCLQTIADLFSDSETEFENKKAGLRVLRDFTDGLARRDQITSYLAICEMTDDQDVERARHNLLTGVETQSFESRIDGTEVEGFWEMFNHLYLSYYQEKHNLVIDSLAGGDNLAEILRSEKWSVFESISSNHWFDRRYFSKAKEIIREIRQLSCTANVREQLERKPFCTCSFSLSEHGRQIDLPGELKRVVNAGLEAFREKMKEHGSQLTDAADDRETGGLLAAIVKRFSEEPEFPSLSSQETRLLRLAAEKEAMRASSIRDAISRAAGEIGSVVTEDEPGWEPQLATDDFFVQSEL